MPADDPQNKIKQPAQPVDKNRNPLHAILLPKVNLTTGEIDGYIPLAYDVDGDGRAILHVKQIP